MLINDIVQFFGVDKAQEVVGFTLKKGWSGDKARPVTQQRAYIASNGKLKMDSDLLKLSLGCAATYFANRNQILLNDVEHEANASIDCANIGVSDYD